MPRPLFIDDAIRERCANLRKYAEEHPWSSADVMAIASEGMPAPGDLPQFRVVIPHGFRVVYTQQVIGGKLYGHLSVSLDDREDKYPNPYAVKEIMSLMGFKTPLEKCLVQLEKIGPGKEAITVIEIIKDFADDSNIE